MYMYIHVHVYAHVPMKDCQLQRVFHLAKFLNNLLLAAGYDRKFQLLL